MKLKEGCRDEENMRLVRKLQRTLEGLDMFNIMYNDYEPFVSIASEKFGHTQVRMMARQFAAILNSREKYIELSRKGNGGTTGDL